MMHAHDRYLTPPETAPEVDEDELMDELLARLWRHHSGNLDPIPFLRFAKAMQREGDFYEWFREGFGYELQKLREEMQEDADGVRADMAHDAAQERRWGL